MCGIAGAFALDPSGRIDRESVRVMTEMIRHRGPDGAGLWTDPSERVCFGHRRLSVIDLATGQQPMADAESGVVVTFNGEIYNYRELRARLVSTGSRFMTQSDTEVLLRHYLQKGPDFVQDLRGMFAFALWDPRAGELMLARDRIGKKPLYYAVVGGRLFFSSSFRAVRRGAGLDQVVDLPALFRYLSLSYIPAPATIDPRIRKLEAATLLRFRSADPTRTVFWDRSCPVPFEGTFNEAVDRLDELIENAVSLRLRSDVPLGVFLSGGIDSSLVAAVAARVSPAPINTFSIGFAEKGSDESAFAAAVAHRLGSEHREFRTSVDALGLIPELVRHYGEPFGDSSAIPTWLLSRATRRHVTVALGGDGGDEGFGGYEWYRTALRIDRLGRWLPGPLVRAAGAALGSSGASFGRRGRLARAAALLAAGQARRFTLLRSFLDPVLAGRICSDALLAANPTPASPGWDPIGETFMAAGGTPLHRMRVADVGTYLADCLMPKIDVASMAHGLELRAPLLDHEVLSFALSLPDAWISDSTTGKKILRNVLYRHLPPKLFDRPKQGFSLPLSLWFLRELRVVADRIPGSEPLLDTGWFRAAGLRSMVDEHFAGTRDHSQRIYDLIILEEWLRQG